MIDSIEAHADASAPPATGKVTRHAVPVFRRDGLSDDAFSAGTASWTMRVGVSPNPPESVSPQLVDNIQTPVTVFQGSLAIPSAPPTASAPAPWDTGNTVTIPFGPAFPYPGGHLCIEITASVTGAKWWWPVDGVMDTAIGAVSRVGTACGPWALQTGEVSMVATRDLVPGESARFAYRGTPGAPAFLALGVAPLPQPIDLDIVGAPGCEWWIDPVAVVPSGVGAALPYVGIGGFANVLLTLPSGPALLGAQFAAQWLEVTTTLVASESVVCQLSSSLPTLGIAVVVQNQGDPSPSVHFTTAPVMRFEWK